MGARLGEDRRCGEVGRIEDDDDGEETATGLRLDLAQNTSTTGVRNACHFENKLIDIAAIRALLL